MMPESSAIQQLPRDVLCEILKHVAADTTSNLGAIASTCKAWKDVVYGSDQTLWRELFLLEYDSPHDSAMFIQPRRGYDWRNVMISRFCVRNFIAKHEGWAATIESPDVTLESMHQAARDPSRAISKVSKPGSNDMKKYNKFVKLITPWRHRFAQFALGLFLDLPRRGAKSRNEPIIEEIRSTTLFRKSVQWTEINDELSDSDWHFLAISQLLAVPRPLYARWEDHERAKGLLVPSGGLVSWHAVYLATCSLHGRMDPLLSCGLQSRGTGFDRSVTCADWAGVEGPWIANIGLGPPQLPFPRSFHLSLANGRDGVQRAYGNDHINIWHNFPETGHPHPTYPPLYFYGYGRDEDIAAFIYGVVTLSSDSPPEVIWTLGSQPAGHADKGVIMRAVELGGVRSRFGAIGGWGPRTHGYRGTRFSLLGMEENLESLGTRTPTMHDPSRYGGFVLLRRGADVDRHPSTPIEPNFIIKAWDGLESDLHLYPNLN